MNHLPCLKMFWDHKNHWHIVLATVQVIFVPRILQSELDDFREYEDTMCNVALPQGCQLKVEDEKAGKTSNNRINCVDLNPAGLFIVVG